ncbi:phytanoyl-CoA dioxygenase family protein [Sphingomonas lenta]|uniref:Phytanoyl-CoA dioxygenase n=1 Tax=Sphingomonas lenta TaxID=1141887 RepID=A0A2A2SCN5_9SPHN|nr:phytanoyl-CoA dioxygenase family protein [Sphingomonas lenta]PAX06942.1 phytanoyl-CoA dioxygenase [Sphingomonas lenta]
MDQPDPLQRNRLSADEVARYERDGFLQIHRPILQPGKFEALKSLFEELLERYGSDDLDVPHFREPRLLDFLLDDEVLDLIEPLVGPDIGLWSSHFISKPPRTGKATPWHEDSAYWEDRVSTMAGIVTVWLAMDATDPENGSMGVIPGSHTAHASEYERIEPVGKVFDRQIKSGTIDEDKAVFFTLAPNQCSLHDARIIHGARPTTSSRRRAGYTMRYFPTTSRIVPETNAEHAVWLARGRDRAGNRYAN